MPAVDFTRISAEALPIPARGQVDYWDSRQSGLGLRVSQGGSRVWVVMARVGGRKRRITLGAHPGLSLEAARRLRDEIAASGPGAARPAGREAPRRPGESERRIRAPLATLVGALRLLQATRLEPRQRGYLEGAIEAAGELLAAIDGGGLSPPPSSALSPPSSSSPCPAMARPGPARLLLCDDDAVNRRVALAMLRHGAYEIDEVDGAEPAIQALQSRPYDLVLMDLSMPGLSGLEATARIHALPGRAGRVPIVALTAHATAQDRARCLEAGMDGYLAKPVDRRELLDLVATILARRPVAGDRLLDTPRSPVQAGLLDLAALAALERDAGAGAAASLLRSFVSETRERLERMRRAADLRAHSDLAREAHSLKSAAHTFGAQALGGLAASLEAAAAARRDDEIAELMSRLGALGESTLAELESFAKF
jgi:CheY-like chemotaxis protein